MFQKRLRNVSRHVPIHGTACKVTIVVPVPGGRGFSGLLPIELRQDFEDSATLGRWDSSDPGQEILPLSPRERGSVSLRRKSLRFLKSRRSESRKLPAILVGKYNHVLQG